MAKPDPFWPEKERYRVPVDAPTPITICLKCGSRHEGPVGWCNEPNPQPKETTQ